MNSRTLLHVNRSVLETRFALRPQRQDEHHVNFREIAVERDMAPIAPANDEFSLAVSDGTTDHWSLHVYFDGIEYFLKAC
jgi:hypothetical protein